MAGDADDDTDRSRPARYGDQGGGHVARHDIASGAASRPPSPPEAAADASAEPPAAAEPASAASDGLAALPPRLPELPREAQAWPALENVSKRPAAPPSGAVVRAAGTHARRARFEQQQQPQQPSSVLPDTPAAAPAARNDRFEKMYDATHRRLRHAEGKLMDYKKSQRALERVCEDLRARLALAEEHAARARDRDAAVLAREAAVADLADAKAEMELLRARLAAREAAAAVARDAQAGRAAIEARVSALERELEARDRILREREAERAELCALIARYEKELQARETGTVIGAALGRTRRLDVEEPPRTSFSRRARPNRTSGAGDMHDRRFVDDVDDDTEDLLSQRSREKDPAHRLRARSLSPESSVFDHSRLLPPDLECGQQEYRRRRGVIARTGVRPVSNRTPGTPRHVRLRDSPAYHRQFALAQEIGHDLTSDTMEDETFEKEERWRHLRATQEALDKGLRRGVGDD